MSFFPLLAAAALSLPFPVPRPDVTVSFTKQAFDRPFTGRLFVMARSSAGEGPIGISWFNPLPFFAQDAREWKPGEPLRFDPPLGHPIRWNAFGRQKFYLQAVIDRELDGSNCITATGNLYSKSILWDPREPKKIHLIIDQTIRPRPANESDTVKFVEIESKRLSAFHGRPTNLRARVMLPKSYAAGTKRYPVVYCIPGFGGTHRNRHLFENSPEVDGVEMLRVVLDPSCRTGHHVFADSANNGPCGRALIEELIPHVEQKFRALGTPASRFLTGHSSGGWASLWLQVTYPEFFGGTWSTAPDPVDFRDFQLVDIYQPKQNIFTDHQGKMRPLARRGGKAVMHFKPFSDMEVVMGHGGQLQSFEAVFSPRGGDGKPQPLWNRQTGIVDPAVAKAWEQYDIRLILERRWKELGPKLAGKVTVIMGAEDTFYLDGATRLLKAALERLGSDAVIDIVPGKDHGNLLDQPTRQRIAREMAQRARKLTS